LKVVKDYFSGKLLFVGGVTAEIG